ncbi:hypothetical protein ACS0TY_027093 [Phlomoides rotata]
MERKHLKSANISRLWDRIFGIGADGEIFALPGINGTDYTMRNFYSDGSEPEGKQSLLISHLVIPEIQEDGKVKDDMGQPNPKAPDDPTKITPNKDQAAVKAKLDVNGLIWNVTCGSMGNPHCVTFGLESCNIHHLDYNFFSPMWVIRVLIFSFVDCVTRDLQEEELDLAGNGPKIEHHAMIPARTNTGMEQIFCQNH